MSDLDQGGRTRPLSTDHTLLSGAKDPGGTGPSARLMSVGKSFERVRALDAVDLALWPSEVHCILGENGAGKSTLMRILAGSYAPSEGETQFFGRTIRLRNRHDGIVQGVGMVQQHHGLIDQLTGAENYLLGHTGGGAMIDRPRTSQLLRATAADFGLQIDPDRVTGRMTTGERQRLEIVIALAAQSDIIIFDEPTSALPTQDAEILMSVIDKLRSRGKAVAYITHKVREVLAIGNRVTVLRRGKVVARLEGAEISEASLSKTMMGDLRVGSVTSTRVPGRLVAELDSVFLPASQFSCGLSDISLTVRAGQIVGVAGMLGSGQHELAQVLCGLRAPASGVVQRPASVAYIPEDRGIEGIAETLSIFDNAIVYSHKRPALRRWGQRINGSVANAFVVDLMKKGDVRAEGPRTRASSLSGGNQQKLVVERELDIAPNLIVAHNPYRGLDVIATEAVRQKLAHGRDQGCGIVLFSPDLEDLFELSDRIVVLAEGYIVGDVDPKRVTPQELGMLMGSHVAKSQ